MRLNKARLEAAFAKSTEVLDKPSEQDPRVQELWAFLEPTLEDRGALEQEAREHLRENTRDIRSWRTARTATAWFAVFVVVTTMVTLGAVLSGSQNTTHLASIGNDNVRVAFLAGCFAIVFGLTALLVRGAFTPRKDEGGGLMPENAKIIMETFGSLVKDKH